MPISCSAHLPLFDCEDISDKSSFVARCNISLQDELTDFVMTDLHE